jgi:CRISPR/Cas system CMR subunit Cmr6 (Cas7 group RAMP superfamily)
MVVNLEESFSMKYCLMVKKILTILYTCEKKVYYVFLVLKRSQCKFKQKETILKLGNTLKSKSKFTKSKIGWGASTCTSYQGFILNPLRAF